MIELEELDRFNPSFTTIEDPVLPELQPIDIILDDTYLFSNEVINILSFDQAIANTGWVLIRYGDAIPYIGAAGTIKTTMIEGLTSWDDTLERAVVMFNETMEVIGSYLVHQVLHEMPPVGSGPYIRRSDSSIIAASMVRVASHLNGIPVAHVSAQHVKKYLVGNARADKRDVQAAIEKRIANNQLNVLTPDPIRFNEHIWDAIGINLTFQEQS